MQASKKSLEKLRHGKILEGNSPREIEVETSEITLKNEPRLDRSLTAETGEIKEAEHDP
jgi:hypothetical protein